MTIQEPVEAGDVRLGPNGPATIRDLRISLHAFSLQYATSEGWFGPYTDTEVAAMPLLCPAKVRRGDGFVRTDGCLFTAEEEDPNVKGLWKNACTTSMRIHEACLREGWHIEGRGPKTAAPTASTAIGAGVATTAALTAIVPVSRYDTEIVVVSADNSRWQFAAASSASVADGLVLVPDEGTGRWLRVLATQATTTTTGAPPAAEERYSSSYQEPVKVGQVRMGQHGPMLIEAIYGDVRGVFRMKYASGDDACSYAPYIASLQLLCPAWEDIGMGDVFYAGSRGRLVIDQHQHRPSVRDRCLDSGWCLIVRGSDDAQQERPAAAATTPAIEPVKVGQVRQGFSGPARVEARVGHEWSLLDSGGPVYYSDRDAAELLLLGPAPEDIRTGDVFETHCWRAILTERDGDKWKAERLTGSVDVTDACLHRGWRLIQRGPATPSGAQVARKNLEPPRGKEVNWMTIDELPAGGDWMTYDEFRARRGSAGVCGVDMGTTGDHTVIVQTRIGEDGQLRVEANVARPALPPWLKVGGWCRLNGIVYESTMVHVVNDAAEVHLRSSTGADTCLLKVNLDHTMTASLAGLPLREMTASEARDAYAERRAVNRQRATALCEAPPRRVLDGFGQKRGPAWQWYQGELSRMLNICNERTPPALFVAEEVAVR